MNIIIRLLAVLLVSASGAQAAEPVAKQFLRYVYGADGIEFTNICHPSDDAWMLRGTKNTNALNALAKLDIATKPTGIISGLVRTDIYFIEIRDGKVDPAFNLDGAYMMQRRVVLRFVYAALEHNQSMLSLLATDPKKVQIVGPRAMPGEMGQYGSIIEMMPVLRSSKPVDDAKSKTVTYRVPIGDEVLSLTLVKDGSTWKVDTEKGIRVSLEFFFR